MLMTDSLANVLSQFIYLFIYSVLFKNRVVFSVPEACFTKEPCTYKDLQKIEYIVENKIALYKQHTIRELKQLKN